MTTFRAGKLSAVMLDKIDASTFLNSADWVNTLATAETSHMGSQGKEFITGLTSGSVNLTGMYDATSSLQIGVTSADQVMDNLIGLINNFPVTLYFDGGVAVGRRCQIAVGKATSYTPTSPVSGVQTIKLGTEISGPLNDGYCISTGLAQTTTTPVLSGSVDNTAATQNGLTASVHVVANTWTGTTSVKVQHSVDNSVWVDLVTQVVPAATQVGYILTVSGTINRYVRSSVTPATGAGSVNVIVAFARN